jgi:hypothetical protein
MTELGWNRVVLICNIPLSEIASAINTIVSFVAAETLHIADA